MRLDRALLLLAGLIGAAAPADARRAFLDAPTAPWHEAAPYVHANVVPHLKDGDFFAMVCTGDTCRLAVEPFDERLSEFVKVLLLERIYRDRKFRNALGKVTQSVRARLSVMTPADREDFRKVFWAELDADPYITDAVRRDFERAQRDGQVRCWACEKDPTYRPTGLRQP